MGRISYLIFSAVVAFGSLGPAFGQFGTSEPTNLQPQENGPAPVRDMSGVWTRLRPEGQFYSNATFTPNPPSLTPYGQELFSAVKDSNAGSFSLGETNDPVLTRCYPPGTPRVYFHPYPFEIVYTEREMVMLYEYDHTVRRVYTDGRDQPEDPIPLWMGHSVGAWENDSTFVVETVALDERTWFDRSGVPHSDEAIVTEVFRRIDRLNLEIEITMEDAKTLAEPWVADTLYYRLAPSHWEIGEISCSGDYLDFAQFESFLEEEQ